MIRRKVLLFFIVLPHLLVANVIPLDELAITGTLNPSYSECEPFISDTIMVFVCDERPQKEIGFYYFDQPPRLRNEQVVSYTTYTHVQINNERAVVTVNTTEGNGVFIFEYDEANYAVPRFYRNDNNDFTLEHVEADGNIVTVVVAFVFADKNYFCSTGFVLSSGGLIRAHPDIADPRGNQIQSSEKAIEIFLFDSSKLYMIRWTENLGTYLYYFNMTNGGTPESVQFTLDQSGWIDTIDFWTSKFAVTESFVLIMNQEMTHITIVRRNDFYETVSDWTTLSFSKAPSFVPFVEIDPNIALLVHPFTMNDPSPELSTVMVFLNDTRSKGSQHLVKFRHSHADQSLKILRAKPSKSAFFIVETDDLKYYIAKASPGPNYRREPGTYTSVPCENTTEVFVSPHIFATFCIPCSQRNTFAYSMSRHIPDSFCSLMEEPTAPEEDTEHSPGSSQKEGKTKRESVIALLVCVVILSITTLVLAIILLCSRKKKQDALVIIHGNQENVEIVLPNEEEKDHHCYIIEPQERQNECESLIFIEEGPGTKATNRPVQPALLKHQRDEPEQNVVIEADVNPILQRCDLCNYEIEGRFQIYEMHRCIHVFHRACLAAAQDQPDECPKCRAE